LTKEKGQAAIWEEGRKKDDPGASGTIIEAHLESTKGKTSKTPKRWKRWLGHCVWQTGRKREKDVIRVIEEDTRRFGKTQCHRGGEEKHGFATIASQREAPEPLRLEGV